MRTSLPLLFTAVLLSLAIVPAPGASPLPAAVLLPDLRQSLPAQLSVRGSAAADGRTRYLLGFRSVVSNVGPGPLLVDAARAGRGMDAHQVIPFTDGTVRRRERVGVLRYQRGGGHSHWHLQDFERYDLIGLGGGRRRSRKVGFCLGDRVRAPVAPDRPPAAATPQFTHRCGLQRPGLRSLVQGISPGYADVYPPHVEDQSVDVTGLRSGRYVLRHRVNPDRTLAEADYSDNAATLLLALRRRPRRAPALSVLRRCPERAWCAPTPRAG